MICTKKDEFIQNFIEMNPSWEVLLNNGTRVFQDDGRPGVSPPSAWIRLGEYCKQNNLYITEMKIRFRSNSHSLESNADGYYFCKGSRGSFGSTRTMQLFYAGVLKNGKLIVHCWKTPEMVKEKQSERDIRKAGACLIKKNTNQS